MSRTYTTVPGDTFEKVSRKVYGVESRQGVLRQANPSVLLGGPSGDPLQILPGVVLTIPPRTTRAPATTVESASPTEASLSIDGEVFRFWTSVLVEDSVDVFSTLEFTATFDSNNSLFRKKVYPMCYTPVTLFIGGRERFRGNIVGASPLTTPESSTVVVTAYSTPAVLNDCTASSSSFPLDYDGQSFADIARALIEPYGFGLEVSGSGGPKFKRVALEAKDKVLPFLIRLAKQRNIMLTNTPAGDCKVFTPVAPGNPVARLVDGTPSVERVSPTFKEQEFYSDVTGLQSHSTDFEAGSYTVNNPFLRGVHRPFVFQAGDTSGGDLKTAVEAMAGRMFANVVTYSVSVPGWLDPKGALWSPNTTVTLLAPEAMVYKETELLVRSVALNQTKDTEEAELELVLPESLSGKMPKTLPWL
jgi:prophage tail gpP-like protein